MLVEDINDHVPTFEVDEYIFSVEENASTGSLVGTVKAVDPDFGQNANVR